MSALRLPEAAQEQHNLETSANPATCWSERGSICPPTVRFNLFAFISTEGRWITGKRVLSHFQPPTRHCYTEHGTRHMAKEYSFCKPLFPYKYILFAINIMIFLKKYTVYWYFLFFFLLQLRNSLSVTQLMTFDDLFQMGKTFNDIQVHIH